ncbi:MAG: hypothetical protein KJO98_05270, partial [Rhodothermia bacterium]|nr:hypothetical protein [Rhodothermia bacterium]
LEVEDVNFHHDSAVLLPDYGTSAAQEGVSPEQRRVTGLAVLYACYRHVRENPLQTALVVGHTDRSGSRAYNQQLSELRADNVLFALKGDREAWVRVARQKSKVEDYQQILLWLTHHAGWDCDPGGKTNVHDAETRQAVIRFQEQYNDRFNASISEDGVVGSETWGAFFDVYMHELKYALGTDDAGLAQAQSSLRFMDCEAIGCGEDFPITADRRENYKNPIDRRVEILFFDDGEEPVVNCRAPRGACVELYEKKMYCVTPVPVDPLPLPSGEAVHVLIQCLFKDPEQEERTFPEACPVVVEYSDGTSDTRQLNEDGVLDCFVLREKQSFTIRLQFNERTYLSSPRPNLLRPEELITHDELSRRYDDGDRLFMLPLDFRLADADWQVTGGSTYDETDGHFKQLSDLSLTNIGSEATPVHVLLDPHWLFVRFEFFDRVFGHDHHGHARVATPPLLLEGYRQPPSSGALPEPDEVSTWIISADDDAKACQAIPWVLQNAGSKPDNQVLIRFRTSAGTFIVSDDAATRRIEVVSDVNRLKPGPNRLKLYDLPEVWKSLHYSARPAGGDGKAFETLTAAEIDDATTPEKPIVFSLDDMVITDEDLNPVAWVASDRCAVFSHKFGKDGHFNLTNSGLFEPDTGNKQSYLTKEPSSEKNRNYVVEYPNWTRLIAAQGNLFDAFDQRTPDRENRVVGARAAVRWLDAAALSSPGNVLAPRPGPTSKEHFVIQPYVEQQYILKTRSLSTGSYDFENSPNIPSGNRSRAHKIGRFDMVLLRCCDTDGTSEKAAVLKYFKFNFDFSGAPSSLSGNAAQKQYVEDAVANVPKRWNGPDGSFNPGPPVIKKKGSGDGLEVNVLWFCQATANSQAHYKIDVVSDNGRSFMASRDGTGELRESAHKIETTSSGQTKLVVAHECGHGGSLPDEYSETGTKCSYFRPPLRSNDVPSDFFRLDTTGMMSVNRDIRGRYSWHVAEWLRKLIGQSFEISHDGHDFEVPLHPNNSLGSASPLRTFVYWPLRSEINTRATGMNAQARVDVLFYALGAEKFSEQLIKPSTSFDGIVVIELMMKVDFPTKSSFTPDGTFGRVRSELSALNRRLLRRFNRRWRITNGTVNGHTFANSLVHFSFRYVVTTFTNESNTRNQRYLGRNGGSVSGYNSLATSLENNHDVHLEVDVVDTPTSESSGLSGKTLTLRSDNYGQFDRFVARFLGMSTAAPPSGGRFPADAEVLPLVGKVMTANAANIQSF